MKNSGGASTAELARLSELIDSIYQGATDPNHWNVVLPQIADWVGASKSLLFTPQHTPEKGGFFFNHGIPDSVMYLWSTRYVNDDVMVRAGLETGLFNGDGNVATGEEIIPFETYRQSVIYRELNHPNGIDHILAGVIFGFASTVSLPTALMCYRSSEIGIFASDEKERLGILVPHVSRALGVMTRLRNMELRIASSLSALDQLSSGVLLFNERGAVVFANPAAKRICDGEDGLGLRHLTGSSSLGEVVTNSNNTQAKLNQAILSAVSPDIMEMAHFSRAVMVERPSGRQEYTLNFSSLVAPNEFGSGLDVPRAIAFITDNAEPIRLDAELLKKTYGLTPAEICLTEVMAEGLTVDEAADRIGISRNTAKSQLRSVYIKTNTNNRARLMRLIMSLAQISN